MRLTLRTILAYLDDVLEPAQARELGEKISESKEAADLMSRIRDVMRRRRIGAPELAGPGSGPDPNMVSDYLENLLTPEQVVEMERLCQASDLHLAEVAACHKILSMVVGNPIDVSDEMRERMYGLGAAKAPVDSVEVVAAPAMAEGMAGIDTREETGLPEYLTRRSFFQQYGLVSLVVLCTLFWIGLVLTDRGLWSRHAGPHSLAQQPVEKLPVAGRPEVVPVKGQGAGLENPPGMAPGESAPNGVVMTSPGIGSTSMPGDGEIVSNPPVPPAPVPPAPVPPAPGGAVPVVNLPRPTVANAMPSMSGAPSSLGSASITSPATPRPVDLNLPPESPFTYQSGDEFDIKRLAGQPEWIVHPINIPVEVDDEIASPAPFQNTYSIVNQIDVTLEAGTRIQRLPRTAETILGLALNRGQLILTRSLSAAEPVTVELLAAGRSRNLTFLEPGTRVAIELALPQPTGRLADEARLTPFGGMAVVTGRLRVSMQGQPDLEIGVGDGFARWPTDRGALVLQADLGVPGWAQPNDVLVTPAIRQLSRLYQKEFISDRTIAQCIGPVVNDRRAGISELAVKTLAMIDQAPYLVTALQSDHPESRLAAISGLRGWLGEDPEVHGELLPQELAKVFRTENLPALERLLWGFSDRDARNPEVSRQLIDWMKDDQIAIRQLAFEFVSRAVGKTYDYQPMAPQAERRAALTRWEDYLKRSGGTLLPAESAAEK